MAFSIYLHSLQFIALTCISRCIFLYPNTVVSILLPFFFINEFLGHLFREEALVGWYHQLIMGQHVSLAGIYVTYESWKFLFGYFIHPFVDPIPIYIYICSIKRHRFVIYLILSCSFFFFFSSFFWGGVGVDLLIYWERNIVWIHNF